MVAIMTVHRPFAHTALALAALLMASAAIAEETVVALSPDAKAKILDAAAEHNATLREEPTINGIGRRIHGEIGMFVGTNGARGVSGAAEMPVGETGTVAIAFENSRFGRTR